MRRTMIRSVGVAAVLAALVPGAAEAAVFMGLGHLPGGGSQSAASTVSADGSVVVGTGDSAAGSLEAFRWTAATGMVGLGDLPGGNFYSLATGVSADGAVVVGYSSSAEDYQAFIWDPTRGMRSLRDVLISQGADLSGWRLFSANGVSADGRTIVGQGTNPSGRFEAWLARLDAEIIIPEPSSLTLLGLGATVLLVCAGRHRRRAGA